MLVRILKYIVPSIFFLMSIWVFTNSASSDIDLPTPQVTEREIIIPTLYRNLFDKYNTFLEAEMDSTFNVGAAVAIVCNDSLEFIKPYGVRKVGTVDSVNNHTLFRIGSVSKGFAGVLAAKLEQDSLICLNDKLRDYLPGLTLKDSANQMGITLKHTLNHTTGLVPHTYDNLIEAGIPMSEIIGRLKEVDIAAPPGQVYAYQNALYSLLDTVLQVKTQRDYSSFLEDKIFRPLGMLDASTDFYTMANGDNVAYPHVNTRKGRIALPPNSRYYNMGPAAGVNASINDMSIWLKALLGNNPDVIDTNIQNAISTPTIQTPLKRRYTWRWNGIEEKYYSLGWRIFTYKGYNIVYHGGFVKGYRAEISFCPELNTGIVFMQNSPNRVSSESMPTFWDMYFEMLTEQQSLYAQNQQPSENCYCCNVY